jgi:hypothetical protein
MAGHADRNTLIPERDGDFALSADSFASEIELSPAEFGVTPADAQTIRRVINEFLTALRVCNTPETRATPFITRKDNARVSAEQIMRTYANILRANMGISDERLAQLHIYRRPSTLSRRSCPATSPLLNFVAAGVMADVLFFRDSMTPKSRAKPPGAERLELFSAYLDEGAKYRGELPPENKKYEGSFKKNPINVPLDFSMGNRRPTFWARWAGFDGEVGPWSLPISRAIAAEAELQAARNGEVKDSEDPSLRLAA